MDCARAACAGASGAEDDLAVLEVLLPHPLAELGEVVVDVDEITFGRLARLVVAAPMEGHPPAPTIVTMADFFPGHALHADDSCVRPVSSPRAGASRRGGRPVRVTKRASVARRSRNPGRHRRAIWARSPVLRAQGAYASRCAEEQHPLTRPTIPEDECSRKPKWQDATRSDGCPWAPGITVARTSRARRSRARRTRHPPGGAAGTAPARRRSCPAGA